MTPARERARRHWMTVYEKALVTAVPALTGKVDWIAASWFFMRGDDARASALRMALRWHDHDTDEPALRAHWGDAEAAINAMAET